MKRLLVLLSLFLVIAPGAIADDELMSIITSGGSSGADNLGNHTATQDLSLAGYNIANVSSMTATNGISGKYITTTGAANKTVRVGNRPRGNNGAVCFTFDDGYKSLISTALPVFQTRGVKATAFIVTDWVGSAAQYLTWQDILDLQAAGWEIGSHTVSHQNLGAIAESAMIAELQNSYNILTASGCNVRGMAYPYGGYTANVKRNAVKFYEYARATTETSYCLPPIKRFEIESHLDETLGNLQIYRTAIDSAAVQNVLVTFYAHDFQANVSSITATLIDYAQSKGVEILTMSEALERYGNAVERAYANTGDMTAISQDGIAMLQAREINCVHPLTTYSDRLFLGWDATNAYFKIQTYGRNLQINPEGNTVTFTNPVMIGSIQHSYVRKTSTYTAANDLYIFCDATSTAFTVTLPAPSTIRTYTIKKVDSSANKITVVPTSGTIDGAANFLLDAQYESATFTADWDVWRVTGHYSGTP